MLQDERSAQDGGKCFKTREVLRMEESGSGREKCSGWRKVLQDEISAQDGGKCFKTREVLRMEESVSGREKCSG